MGADGQDGHIARKDVAPGQSHQSRVHTDTGVLYHRNAVSLQLPGDSPADPHGIVAAGFRTASHQREPAPGHAIPEQSLPGGHQHLQTRSATADHHHLQGPTAGKRQHLRPEMNEPVDRPQHEGMLCGPRHHLLQAQAVDNRAGVDGQEVVVQGHRVGWSFCADGHVHQPFCGPQPGAMACHPLHPGGAHQRRQRDPALMPGITTRHEARHHATVGLVVLRGDEGDLQVAGTLPGQTRQHMHMGVTGAQQNELFHASLVVGHDRVSAAIEHRPPSPRCVHRCCHCRPRSARCGPWAAFLAMFGLHRAVRRQTGGQSRQRHRGFR